MKPNEKAQELYDKFARWLPDSGDISCLLYTSDAADD